MLTNQTHRSLKRLAPRLLSMSLLAGFFMLVSNSAALAQQTVCDHAPATVPRLLTAAEVCAQGGNTCGGGTATIVEKSCIGHGAVLDFGTDELVIAAGGELQLESLRETELMGCPTEPSTTAEILADGDITVQDGGSINSITATIAGAGATHAGALYIQTPLSVIVEPGGRIQSDRVVAGPTGQGRPGVITIVAGGRVLVDIDGVDPSLRGVISANSSSAVVGRFLASCGVPEITIFAEGQGVDPAETIVINGTVENVAPPGTSERFLGGVIRLFAGAALADLPNAPSPFPYAGFFPSPTSIPFPNPPTPLGVTSTRVLIGTNGLVNIDARDSGGGIIRIVACFFDMLGLVKVGGNAHTGIDAGRERRLPTIIEIRINQEGSVTPDGFVLGVADMGVSPPPAGIVGSMREGFRQHVGQDLTDGAGDGNGCDFLTPDPPGTNGPLGGFGSPRGGTDICIFAHTALLIDGTNVGNAEFAVRARETAGQQRAGTLLAVVTTAGPGSNLTLVSNAMAADFDPNPADQDGGLIVVQSESTLNVNAVLTAAGEMSGNRDGGEIQVQAVEGSVTANAVGFLDTSADDFMGIIGITENINDGTTPMTSAGAVVTDVDGVNMRVLDVDPPALIPCGNPACFCIISVVPNFPAGQTTIFGLGLDFVTTVETGMNCTPGTGTDVTGTITFISDTQIRIDTIVAVGDSVILSGDTMTVGSSSCSNPVGP